MRAGCPRADARPHQDSRRLQRPAVTMTRRHEQDALAVPNGTKSRRASDLRSRGLFDLASRPRSSGSLRRRVAGRDRPARRRRGDRSRLENAGGKMPSSNSRSGPAERRATRRNASPTALPNSGIASRAMRRIGIGPLPPCSGPSKSRSVSSLQKYGRTSSQPHPRRRGRATHHSRAASHDWLTAR